MYVTDLCLLNIRNVCKCKNQIFLQKIYVQIFLICVFQILPLFPEMSVLPREQAPWEKMVNVHEYNMYFFFINHLNSYVWRLFLWLIIETLVLYFYMNFALDALSRMFLGG